MSINLNYSKKSANKISSNLVLFCDEKYKTTGLKKYVFDNEFSYINDLIKTIDIKNNLYVFEVNSKKKIVLVSIKNSLKTSDIENLGAEFYKKINHGKNNEYFLISDSVPDKQDNFLGYFLHGLKLKSYEFKKYKSKKDTRIININIVGDKNKPSAKNQLTKYHQP